MATVEWLTECLYRQCGSKLDTHDLRQGHFSQIFSFKEKSPAKQMLADKAQ